MPHQITKIKEHITPGYRSINPLTHKNDKIEIGVIDLAPKRERGSWLMPR